MPHFPDFQAVTRIDPIDLLSAGLCYARNLAYPQLDIDHYIEQIEQLTALAKHQFGDELNTAEQARILAHFLFVAEGFSGNTQTYGDPRNSFLNDVLDRRLGIPITLSVLFIIIARRLNIDAYGVGLPGHFVVGVDTGVDFPLLIDPFHWGQIITEQNCSDLIARTTGYTGRIQPQWLAPQTNKLILTRMLNNLRYGYIRIERWSQAILAIQHLKLIQPDMAELQRDEGLLYFRTNNVYKAAQHLQHYLEQNPSAPDGDAIRQNVGQALSRWVKMN